MTTNDAAIENDGMLAQTVNVENAMVNQKNELRTMINYASEWEELRRAMTTLEFAAPLWTALGYEYKVRELKQAIRDRADFLIDAEESFLRMERKNSKHRASSERTIRELKDIRGCMA